MRIKAAGAILATVALVAFALPAGAAATKTYKQPASVLAALEGNGTNGFRYLLLSSDPGYVILSASKDVGKAGETSVNYFEASSRKTADASDSDLDLKLGKLGHFRGEFVATSTQTEKPSKFCEGGPTTTEEGYFVGSFKFRGEGGYTRIDGHRESGSLIHVGAQTCKLAAEPGYHRSSHQKKVEEKSEEREFRLVASDRKARTLFLASRELVPHYEVRVDGGKVGRFRVSYSASTFDFAQDAAENFQVPNLTEPLKEAIIEPPAPFSGTSTFRLETPKKASWTGDLAIELPVLGTVPLTGPTIAAGLCQGRSDCTNTLPRLPQLTLEAGRSSGFVTIAVSSKAAVETQTIR